MKFLISDNYDCYDTDWHNKFNLKVDEKLCKAFDIIGFINTSEFQLPTERDLLYYSVIEPVRMRVRKVPRWFRNELRKYAGLNKSTEFNANWYGYYSAGLIAHHLGTTFTPFNKCFVGTMLDFIINNETYKKLKDNRFPVRSYYVQDGYALAGGLIWGEYLYIISCTFSSVASEEVKCAINKFRVTDRSLFDAIVNNEDSCHNEEIRKIIGKSSILLRKKE